MVIHQAIITIVAQTQVQVQAQVMEIKMKNLQEVIIGNVVNFKNSSTEYFVTSIVSMNKK